MKRLILVYNPRSSRFFEVEKKVIEEARKLKGWMVCKFEVRRVSVRENAKELAKIIRKDDLVVSAGGDGTASVVVNAIMESGKRATMAEMGFGNFNDYEGTFGKMSLKRIVKKFSEGRFEDFYPIEVKVDGEHFLYAGMYFTIGMLAESVGVFEKEKVRKKLVKAKNRLSYSASRLFFWYLRNKRRKDFLLGMTIDKKDMGNVVKITTEEGTTDYIALNGESLAGVVEAEGWTRERKSFWSGEMKNRSIIRMMKAFIKSETDGELPGQRTEGDLIKFSETSRVFLHIEGERVFREKVFEIQVEKTGEGFRVIRE